MKKNNMDKKELEDQLDLYRDEFKRIISLCNSYSSILVTSEIKGIAERGCKNITQHVHVIVQRDKAEAKVLHLKNKVTKLKEELENASGLIISHSKDVEFVPIKKAKATPNSGCGGPKGCLTREFDSTKADCKECKEEADRTMEG